MTGGSSRDSPDPSSHNGDDGDDGDDSTPPRVPPTAPAEAALYEALRGKVDAFFDTASEADPGIACASGCAACCRAELSVNGIEAHSITGALRALPQQVREQMSRRARGPGDAGSAGSANSGTDAGAESVSDAPGYCVMLDPSTLRCDIYASRPLVCRSQGLALAYPPGFIPEAAVRARGAAPRGASAGAEGPDITWCPLCYTNRPPPGAHVLDAYTIDKTLALIEHRRVATTGPTPPAEPPRYALRTLAR